MARAHLIVLIACWGVAALGLATGFDPAAADALWARAEATSGDLRDPAYFDAARLCAKARPWDEAWGRCRARLEAVDPADAEPGSAGADQGRGRPASPSCEMRCG